MKLKSKKQKEQCYTLHVRREKRREKNQITTSDNPTIVSFLALFHMEEDTVMHLGRQWKTSFGHRVTSHMPFE